MFHIVLDRLDKARAALRIFVLSPGALGLAGFAVVVPVAFGGILADSILVIETDVEPDRRVERAMLVDAKPRQLFVKRFSIFLAEVSVRDAPISNRPAHAMDQLPNRRFALGGVLFAVEIFGNDHLRRKDRPGLRNLNVLLFKNDLVILVGDFSGPAFPFDLIEGLNFWVAKDSLDAKTRFHGSTCQSLPGKRRRATAVSCG